MKYKTKNLKIEIIIPKKKNKSLNDFIFFLNPKPKSKL